MTSQVKRCSSAGCNNKGLWKVKGKYYCMGHANMKEGIYNKKELI